jgi:hypothetical protein
MRPQGVSAEALFVLKSCIAELVFESVKICEGHLGLGVDISTVLGTHYAPRHNFMEMRMLSMRFVFLRVLSEPRKKPAHESSNNMVARSVLLVFITADQP